MRLPPIRHAASTRRRSDRRPPIRLTSRAAGVLVVSIVLLVGGQALGYPLLRVLGGAGLAAVLVSVGTLFRRPRLVVHRVLYPDRVECGRPALARLVVRNESGRRQPSFVATDLAWATPAAGAGSVSSGADPTPGSADGSAATGAADRAAVRVASLAVGGVATYHYELPTSRRGRLQVGPLTSDRSDALGLASCRTTIGDTAALLVHPRQYAARPATGIRQRHHFEGPVSMGPLRGSIDLRRLREYVPGDEVRHVHWKASARTGRLMVREYADPEQPRLRLLLDTRTSSLHPDRFEAAVSIAASIMVASARADHRLRFTTTCGIDHEVESVGDLLDELAEVQQVSESGTGFPPDGVAASSTGSAGRRPRSAEELAALSRDRDGGALVVLSGEQAPDELAKWPDLDAAYRPVICFDSTGDDEPAPGEQIRIVGGVHVIRAATAEAAIEAWNHLSTGGAT